MRALLALIVVSLILFTSMTASADVQDVMLDAKLVIGGNWLTMDSDDYTWLEQRTLLGVRADFTDEVSAYIQFDNFSIWGEDFRSMDWESGYDDRATIGEVYLTGDDAAELEVYQAYIEAREMWGTPIQLRLGRQELVFGAEWLVGNNDTGWGSRGLSFDALRVDYVHDEFVLTGVMGKLQENVFGDLFEEDINLYMIYGSYRGIENVEIDGYFIYVDDDVPAAVPAPKATIGTEGEDMFIFAIRVGGVKGAYDFEFDIAYQDQSTKDSFIDIEKQGFMALDDDNFSALHLEIGYNWWDYVCRPRVFIGGAWYEGNGDGAGFDRLFSDMRYTQFPYDLHHNLSNVIIGWIGIEGNPVEPVRTRLKLSYFQLDEVGGYWAFPGKQPPEPVWFENPDELGWELEASAIYRYSEDLTFTLTYAHFFGDDAVDNEDHDYLGVTSTISF